MKTNMEYYKYLLCGLFILSFVKQGLTMPTTLSTASIDDDASMAVDASYPEDYVDEDPKMDTNPIHNEPSTEVKLLDSNTKPTEAPYFATESTRMHAKNGDEVLLDCNPINFSDNVIFWYKGDTLIVSGHEPLNTRFTLKGNNKLVIPNAVEMDSDSYYCEVFPQKIRHQFDLHISEELLPESIGTNQLNAESISASTESENGASSIQMNSFTVLSLVLGMIIFLRI